jgi:Xaa-Pro aminopeptidase
VLVSRSTSELVDIGGLIAGLRETKDPDELAAIRLSLRAAEAAHSVSRKLLSPGIREIDYYSAIVEHATRAVERPFLMLCDLVSGERSTAGGGPPSTRTMNEGELAILDFFPVVEGYRADITNTLCVGGRPTAAQLDAFALTQAALRAGEGLLRPGTPVAEVFAAMDAEIRRGGEGRSLTHHAGHAIGLGHPESPHIVPRSDRTLTSGMVITLEPGVYEAETGGIRIEHNYLIKADGYERLSAHELGLI